jgi:CBS domain-containing protein
MTSATVRDLMHAGLVTCPRETRLGEAAALLVRHAVHALVVVDGQHNPVGVLSDFDLLAGEWLGTDRADLETLRNMTAGELNTAPVITIEVDASAGEAAARLREERIGRLVVIEDDRAVGIISISDLVANLARVSLGQRTVADVMSRGIVVCLADTPIPAAARAMTERRSRSLVVVEPMGQPLGVVTGIDLLAVFQDADATTVRDLVQPPLTIGPDETLREAADRLLEHETHRLVVVDPANPEGMPLGLVSTSDIVAAMAEPGSLWQA